MTGNGNGVEKRLAFLEKVYLEDRARWTANDARWQSNDGRWQANNRRLERMLHVLGEQSRRLERLEERVDATLKIVKRLAER